MIDKPYPIIVTICPTDYKDYIYHCKSTMKLILLCLLLAIVLGKDNPKYDRLFRKPTRSEVRQQQYWFDQTIDHTNYDAKSNGVWKQRYWAVDSYFNPKSGPVFIYICGQWTCDGIPEYRTWITYLAQRLQGFIFVLQHRFYGESLPFKNQSFSLKNMALLNSEQALRDLAHFIEVMKVSNDFRITNNPWISVGGSYPGALSAWLRYKYPHLVIGAIASSAVVLAIEDFQDFDEQIYQSSEKSSPLCSSALNQSSHIVQAILNSSQAEAFGFKAQFKGGQKLTNREFLFFWADTIVLTIQYGGRTQLCYDLMARADDQFNTLIENAKNYQVYQYGSYYLRNETFAYETQSMARPWYYQYCTEYGFFQTFSNRHPMRSFQLNLDFFRQFCSDSFGPSTWPKIQRKNTQYGGLQAKSTKIIFSNGIEDPWRWASLQNADQSKDLISMVIDCDDCAHCIDLYTPQDSDSPNLKKARNTQFLTLQEWVDEYWRQLKRQNFEKILKNEM